MCIYEMRSSRLLIEARCRLKASWRKCCFCRAKYLCTTHSKPNKTHTTTASVDAFIDKQPKASSSRAASAREVEIGKEVRDDCRTLMKLMHELTGAEPYMYGPTIVGFGTYHYTYASGHEGDAPLAAFSPRKPELVIYFTPGIFEHELELMAKLGKCKTTKGCLYVKRLNDINMKVLKTLLKKSIALTRKTWPPS